MAEKLQKLRKRFDIAIQTNDFYYANQILRTICSRMLVSTEYGELLDFLYSACMTFCDAKQYNSALDAAELFADFLLKNRVNISSQLLDMVTKIFFRLPSNFDSDDAFDAKDRRIIFVNRIMNWSIALAEQQPDNLQEISQLHLRFAQISHDQGNQEAAERYLKAASLLSKNFEPPPEPVDLEFAQADDHLEKKTVGA